MSDSKQKSWTVTKESLKEKLNDLKQKQTLSPRAKMILRTLLFAFIGQFISVMTLAQHYLTNTIVKTNDSTIVMLLRTIQFFLIGIIMILFTRKIKNPKPIYFIISLLYVGIIFMSFFAYRESNSHMLIVNIWCLISILVYVCIMNKAKFTIFQLLGLVLTFFGLILVLSFLLYAIYYDNLTFFTDHFIDNFIAILHGIAFAASIVLQEHFLKTKEEVFHGLMWISLLSSGVMLLVALSIADYPRISVYFSKLSSTDFIQSSGLIILGVIMFTIIPFYINKCSAYVLMVNMNSQLYWKFVIDIILYGYKLTFLWNTFGTIIMLIGMGFYLFDKFLIRKPMSIWGPLFDSISEDRDSKKKASIIKAKQNKENAEKEEEKENKASNDDTEEVDYSKRRDKKNTQVLFVDTGDKASVCSAFSFPSKNEEILNSSFPN